MTRAKAIMHPVAVRATRDGTGAYHFSAESDLSSDEGHEFNFHKDRHGMRKHDFHLVEFVLDDRTGEQLKFPRVPHDAMWVVRVDDPSHPTCPDKNSVSDYSVMDPICVCDGGKRLIVRNDNPRKEAWSFTLNFVPAGVSDTDANEYVSWDPIGTNHNGGS